MSYNSRRKKPRGPRFGESHIVTKDDGTVCNWQREYVGYGFTTFHFVGSLAGVSAAVEREQKKYPEGWYGGFYGEPEDLGSGLYLVYGSHSESCEMTDLLTRLKEATAASRELDFWITCRAWDASCDYTDEELQADIDLVGIGGMYVEKPFTSSIDAALALVERKLPGWACGFDCGPKTIIAFVDRHDFSMRLLGAKYTAEAKTVPLAILQSLFLALQETDHG